LEISRYPRIPADWSYECCRVYRGLAKVLKKAYPLAVFIAKDSSKDSSILQEPLKKGGAVQIRDMDL